MKRYFTILAIAGLTLNSAMAGESPKQSLLDYPSPVSSSPWEVEFTPYFWLANMKGTMAVAGASSPVSIGIDDILNNLDFAFMATGGVRYNRVGVFADFLYVDVSPSSSTPGNLYNRVDIRLQHTIFDPKASFRLLESDKGWLDLLAGARYIDLELGLALQPGSGGGPALSGSGNESWWDAVGGIRGRYNFSDRVFLTGLADIGGGSSDITWQVQAALGYKISERVDFTAGYRYLDYEYESGDFAHDVATRGAFFGLGFNW